MSYHQPRLHAFAMVAGFIVFGFALCSMIRPMLAPRKALARPSQGVVMASTPLLSSGRIENSNAFHRLAFAAPVSASEHAQFRNPGDIEPSAGKRILTITKRTKPLPVMFSSPRQSWMHLTEKARLQIDRGFSTSAKWERMVFHGSANKSGSAAQLNRFHQRTKGLKGGLAYHFVIGNGTSTADGTVEVGERWFKSLPGGGSEPDAESAISVCFIGDFHAASPTKAQLEALDELVDYLTIKVGTLPVISHRELVGSDVSCLGPFFPETQIMDALARHAD